MSTLEKAIEIAAKAHAGQIDKAGQPYILHPLRMMLSVSRVAQIPAVLHDVVEDTKVTLNDLQKAGFSEEVIEVVGLLTKTSTDKSDTAYFEYLSRVAKNPIAREVKLADLRDNMDPSRIANPTEKDLKRMEKYKRAFAMLSAETSNL